MFYYFMEDVLGIFTTSNVKNSIKPQIVVWRFSWFSHRSCFSCNVAILKSAISYCNVHNKYQYQKDTLKNFSAKEKKWTHQIP